jgi:hypothetical protein
LNFQGKTLHCIYVSGYSGDIGIDRLKESVMQLKKFAACLVCLLGFVASAQTLFAQQVNCSYVVVYPATYSNTQIEQAFSTASLDAYRKQTVRRSMFFENGAEIQLYSVAELQARGCPVEPEQAMKDDDPLDAGRLFALHPAGIIMESVKKLEKE